MSDGAVELERAIDSIRVGYRIRQHLGDLTELVESIRELGLLQPVTITPDGALICGVRRLEACRILGMRYIKVWIRSGLSTPLKRLLAEQHENIMRAPLAPTEAARIYQELKAVYQEEARANIAAHQFGAAAQPGLPTVGTPVGNASKKAALAVTGTRSDLTLERVLEVDRIARDPEAPAPLKELAAVQLTAMDADRNVAAPYARVKAAEAGLALEAVLEEAQLPRTLREQTEQALRRLEEATSSAELMARAREAMKQARASRSRAGKPRPSMELVRRAPVEPRRYSVRAFLMTLQETDFWWTHYDPQEIGRALSQEQWAQFDEWIRESAAFHATADETRRAGELLA